MVMVTNTTTSVGRMLGMVIRVNICQALTPSSRAASIMSIGMPLSAAESTTIAKPAWIQTMTTMRNSVFSGGLSRNCCDCPPSPTQMPLSRPIWSRLVAR